MLDAGRDDVGCRKGGFEMQEERMWDAGRSDVGYRQRCCGMQAEMMQDAGGGDAVASSSQPCMGGGWVLNPPGEQCRAVI